MTFLPQGPLSHKVKPRFADDNVIMKLEVHQDSVSTTAVVHRTASHRGLVGGSGTIIGGILAGEQDGNEGTAAGYPDGELPVQTVQAANNGRIAGLRNAKILGDT
jgi:hypothetical protein